MYFHQARSTSYQNSQNRHLDSNSPSEFTSPTNFFNNFNNQNQNHFNNQNVYNLEHNMSPRSTQHYTNNKEKSPFADRNTNNYSILSGANLNLPLGYSQKTAAQSPNSQATRLNQLTNEGLSPSMHISQKKQNNAFGNGYLERVEQQYLVRRTPPKVYTNTSK